MIISHKHKFIFIKTGKTAGTSIEVFLSQHCGPDDIVTPIFPDVEPHIARNFDGYFNPLPELYISRGKGIRQTFMDVINKRRFYNHLPASKIKSRLPHSVWENYFKFCVERNPWDKTLSDYYMRKWRSDNKLSFDDYLSEGRFPLGYYMYTDRRGDVLVDSIVKYEDLVNGLGEIFDRLGIPFDGSLGVNAKGEYRGDRRPYQMMYSDAQRRLIEKVFDAEIRIHGYRF
jgi:hypothetical protein